MSWLDASALVLSPSRHTGLSPARLPALHQTPAARLPPRSPEPLTEPWGMVDATTAPSPRPLSSQSVQHPAGPCRQTQRVLLLSYRVRGGLIKSSIIYPHHHPDLHLPPLPSKSHLCRFQSPLRLKGPHKGALIPV